MGGVKKHISPVAPWLIGRFRDSTELAADPAEAQRRMAEVGEWLTGLGVDPNQMLVCCALLQSGDRYALHLSERVLNEFGAPQWDNATDRCYSRPVVVSVEKDSWPAWLTGLNAVSVTVKVGDEP
jgi:hypothetical protein